MMHLETTSDIRQADACLVSSVMNTFNNGLFLRDCGMTFKYFY